MFQRQAQPKQQQQWQWWRLQRQCRVSGEQGQALTRAPALQACSPRPPAALLLPLLCLQQQDVFELI